MTAIGLFNALYNTRFVNVLTSLYNNDSMMPLFVRDITLDVPGRLVQASRRDGFGNEEFVEQLIEQGGTSVIWGLGVPMLRQWIDQASINYHRLPKAMQKLIPFGKYIEYNDISRHLLEANIPNTAKRTGFLSKLKNKKSTQSTSSKPLQILTHEKIQHYAAAQQQYITKLKTDGKASEKLAKELTALANKRQKHLSSFFDKAGNIQQAGLLKQYQAKAVTKMITASVIPAFLIAIGLPLIFQWVTRKSIDKKKAQLNVHPELTPAEFQTQQQQVQQQKDLALRVALNHVTHPNPAAIPMNTGGTGANAFQQVAPTPLYAQPASQPVRTTSYPNSNSLMGKPQFGSLLKMLTAIESSDKWNTLLVDGVISGGRVVIARNIYDKLENLIQEVGTIYFLFFAMKPLQRWFGKTVDKVFNTFNNAFYNPQAMAHAHQLYTKSPDKLLHQLEDFRQAFMTDHIMPTALQEKKPTNNAVDAFEHLLFKQKGLDTYLLQGGNDNLLFELAKKTGAIDMVKPKKGAYQLWNYSKEVDVKAMLGIAKDLQAMVHRLQEKSGVQSLEKLGESGKRYLAKGIQRTAAGKTAVWILSALTCSGFLAWGIPRFKQKVTEWLTGQDAFPGKFNDGRRQGLFDTTIESSVNFSG